FSQWGVVDAAQTLSTTFVDVVVLDVPLGVPHSIEDNSGHGIMLRNSGESDLLAKIDVLVPSVEELRGNARAIPDPTWIQIQPAEVLVPAHRGVECKVAVNVPKIRRHRNRFYQAMIWIRTGAIGTGGVRIQAGLKSRLRLKTLR